MRSATKRSMTPSARAWSISCSVALPHEQRLSNAAQCRRTLGGVLVFTLAPSGAAGESDSTLMSASHGTGSRPTRAEKACS